MRPANTEAMLAAPRCGARTRRGTPCRSPRVRGRKRCRMHGGARGAGAPLGSRNAWKHGEYSAEEKRRFRAARALVREANEFLDLAGAPGPRRPPAFRPKRGER